MSNTSQYALPNPVAPHADESLVSLLVRNAEAYRFWNPTRLLQRIRPPELVLWSLCDTDPNGQFGHRLRCLLGLDEPVFRRLSPWTDSDNTLSILGQPVWKGLSRPAIRAACPLCLREAAYHRAAWFIDAMPVCPVHGVWLLDHCQRCHRPLAWAGSSVHKCGARRCRWDIRDASKDESNSAHLTGTAALLRLLNSGASADAPHGMPFGTLLKVMFFLGRMSLGFERVNDTRHFIKVNRRRMPEILDAGWKALDDWPRGFDDLLDRLVRRGPERCGRGGLKKSFGQLSSEVFQWKTEFWGLPIARAFTEHVARRGDLPVSSQTLERYGAAPELPKRHMTFSEASAALDISVASVQRLAERMGLYIVGPDGAGTPSVVDAEAILRLRAQRQEALYAEDARKVVAVGTKVFAQLNNASLLPRIPEHQRVVELRAYRRSGIEGFLAACRGDAESITRQEARERGLWTISSAVAPGRTFVDICRALRDGRLAAAMLATNEAGLQNIRLNPNDVERVLPNAKGTMSAIDVSRRLRVRYYDVLVWARRGFIQSGTAPGQREDGLRFTHADVDAFRAAYVTGEELSQEYWGRGNGAVRRYLQLFGVEPVSHRIDGNGTRTLFRRVDLTPEALMGMKGGGKGGVPSSLEIRRQSFERAKRVADAISQKWGVPLARTNSRFTDPKTGRVVQVVSGRRQGRTGSYWFKVNQTSLALVCRAADGYVALVPREGCCFLLIPAKHLPRVGGTSERRGSSGSLPIGFDGHGRPLEMGEWAVPMPNGAVGGASA